MTIRAKFQLTSITSHSWHPTSKTLKFTTSYDPAIPEDQRFQKATPLGSFEMQVDNPAALDQLKLGAYYYLDLTEAA